MQQCAHCRFRKTVFIFKALARTKIVSKVPRVNQISALLHLNSQEIVNFCIGEMETRWGVNCFTEFQKHREQEIQQKDMQITEKVQTVIHKVFDVEKIQLNKIFSSLDELTFNQKVHCFIRSPANSNANEWFFSYTSGEKSTNSIEFFSRSKGASQDQRTGANYPKSNYPKSLKSPKFFWLNFIWPSKLVSCSFLSF